MQERLHPKWPTRRQRVRMLAGATLLSALLAAGCASGATDSTAASAGAAGTRASTASSTDAAPAPGPHGGLAFAECMRAHGVSNFPDPSAGGGFAFHASAAVASSPAFRAAQASCGRLLPGPVAALGGGSFSPQVEAHALAQLRAVAQCMRGHGISNFPDPTVTAPAHPSLGTYSEITNYEGVWLLFPPTVDMRSPAWERAAAACGALAESFNHPHH